MTDQVMMNGVRPRLKVVDRLVCRLKVSLGGAVDVGKERYGLN